MGQESKSKAERREVIHRTRLFGGRVTAEEFHRANAFGGERCRCGQPAAILCRSFATVEDLDRHAPEVLIAMAVQHGGSVPVVEFTYGKFVLLGRVYACSSCRTTLERAAAHHPSWVLVEFSSGPGPDNAVVQVPG